jgi:hypothetical protein
MRGPLPPAGALIGLVGEHALVESGMPGLGSCATLVVPELGGKGRRKTPSLRSSKAPTRSTHAFVRDVIAAPPVAALI